jgi:tripartite-type tricarboxylate transporter receptor subunit TctC
MMKFNAKKMVGVLLVSIVLSVILVGCSSSSPAAKKPAAESNYPNKPITLIVPYSAGGSSDVGARLAAKRLEKELGQPVVVENVTGAAGWIGWTKMAKAKPDGYTLSLMNMTFITTYLNPEKKRDMNLDSVTLLANHVWDVTAWAVRPDSPYKNIKELMEYVKANPGKVTVATSGVYTQHHIALIALDKLGYKMRPVHTSGVSEALTTAMGGHVDIVSMGAGDIRNAAQEGTMRPLVVLDKNRSKFLPNVPTMSESVGLDVNAFASRGFATPANTDPAAVKRLEAAFKKILADPEHIAEMEKMGLEVHYMDSKDYKAFMKDVETNQKKTMGW